MSNQHSIRDTADEGKTGLYTNRTRSQAPIQPSLFGNSHNLPKKPKEGKDTSKERGQAIQPLPWPDQVKDRQSTKSPIDSGAIIITNSSPKQNQQTINSKELDANQINYKNQKESRRQQATSSKELGANAISKVQNDIIISKDAINSGQVSPLTSEDEEEIKPSHQDYSNIGHVDKDLPLPTPRERKKVNQSPKNSSAYVH
jgi:hypothetical protein